MNRRQLSKFVGGATLPIFVSGCATITGGSISLVMTNRDDTKHDIKIALSANREVVFEESYELAPNDEKMIEEIVDGGEYSVRVIVEDDENLTYENIEINDCDGQKLFVRLSSGGDVVIRENIC